jgi:hypothetical protein
MKVAPALNGLTAVFEKAGGQDKEFNQLISCCFFSQRQSLAPGRASG